MALMKKTDACVKQEIKKKEREKKTRERKNVRRQQKADTTVV